MTAPSPRIFFVGSYMHAFVLVAPRFPLAGETVFGTEADVGPGGKGSNQAIAAARLGARVAIWACVGDDSMGTYADDLWRDEGIDTALVTRKTGVTTGMAFIMIDATGQNQIIVVPGANDRLPDYASAIDAAIAVTQVAVAQFESPVAAVEAAFSRARRHGVRTILNPAPARVVPDSLLALADVITPNESEAAALSGEASSDPAVLARAICARGARAVVLTLGESGAYVLDETGGRRIPPVRVQVRDTTGAGDAFTGALAVALARGATLDDAVAYGNLGGAFCATRLGVVPGLGREADLLALKAARTS